MSLEDRMGPDPETGFATLPPDHQYVIGAYLGSGRYYGATPQERFGVRVQRSVRGLFFKKWITVGEVEECNKHEPAIKEATAKVARVAWREHDARMFVKGVSGTYTNSRDKS
jgi:hypothetical protein